MQLTTVVRIVVPFLFVAGSVSIASAQDCNQAIADYQASAQNLISEVDADAVKALQTSIDEFNAEHAKFETKVAEISAAVAANDYKSANRLVGSTNRAFKRFLSSYKKRAYGPWKDNYKGHKKTLKALKSQYPKDCF